MLVGMKAYSLDLRQKMLRAGDQRLGSQRAMATRFGVSQSVVETGLRGRRATGELRPRPHAGGRRALGDATA
jgi:transposase